MRRASLLRMVASRCGLGGDGTRRLAAETLPRPCPLAAFRTTRLALGAACLDLLQHRRRAGTFDKVGTHQLAILGIEEQAVRITEVTVRRFHHAAAARQGSTIDL